MIKSNKIFIIKIILVVLWLLVIFFFSNVDSNKSTSQSFGVTKTIVTYSLKLSNYVHITNIELNDNNLNKISDEVHPYIRKIAHFSEFFILAVLVLLMIKETNLNYYYTFTILFCLLIAILDESHQILIKGRSGNFIDVLIDSSGIIMYLIFNKLFRIIKK